MAEQWTEADALVHCWRDGLDEAERKGVTAICYDIAVVRAVAARLERLERLECSHHDDLDLIARALLWRAESMVNDNHTTTTALAANELVQVLALVRERQAVLEQAEQACTTRSRGNVRLEATRATPELLERLAALAHEQWSGWARWMIDKWSPECVARWERQIVTPYDQLSEREKESDRNEARRVLEVIRATLGEADNGTTTTDLL